MNAIGIRAAASVLIIACVMANTAFADWTQCRGLVWPFPRPEQLPPFEETLVLIYNRTDGNLSVSVGSPIPADKNKLTTLEILSPSGIFIPPCDNTEGDFDICRPDTIAKVRTRGFGSLSFGNVLPTWLTTGDLGILADASYLSGGDPSSRGGVFLCFDMGPNAGDFNDDGVVDALDIDLHVTQWWTVPADRSYDLNSDGYVDNWDWKVLVSRLKNTWFGDTDLNGEFDSSDMVHVFAAGKYETGEDAGWSEGDWNGDGIFSSSDMVFVFAEGGYEKGPRTDAVAVPEPGGWLLLVLGVCGLLAVRCRR